MKKREKAICIAALLSFTASSYITLPVYAASAETQQNISKAMATSLISTTPRSILSTTAAMIAAAMDAALETVAIEEEKQWYREKIPMKKEHQKLLWDYCVKRKLDYIDMLALISVESNFNEKCTSANGRYRGYFQMSKGNCANVAKALGTANKPLDGAISINWGTAFYSWILQDKRVKDLAEDKKRDVALSIYQRGTLGYDKSGLSKSYLKAYYNKRDKIVAIFAEGQQ